MLNPNSKTAHFGRPAEFLELEGKLHKWVEEMRQENIPVRTKNIFTKAVFTKAVSLDGTNTFKNGTSYQKISNGFNVFLSDVML
jgi:hypothetical protein